MSTTGCLRNVHNQMYKITDFVCPHAKRLNQLAIYLLQLLSLFNQTMKGVNKPYTHKMKLKYSNSHTFFFRFYSKSLIPDTRQQTCSPNPVKIDSSGIKGHFYLDHICVNNGLFTIKPFITRASTRHMRNDFP